MRSALMQTGRFLRGEGLFACERVASRPGWWLPAMICGFAPLYGSMMGSFCLDSPSRLLIPLYGAIKVPLLLFATSALCLPGFFVLNTLLGLRDDFREATQAILAGQAGLSIALASLAPITRFWYFCDGNYRAALLFNAAMFTLATLAGQMVMFRYYRTLIRRRPNHRIMLFAWLGLYAFVGIQMGWLLRPFIGAPTMPAAFFRPEPFSNAYVVVVRLIFGA
jgi:hypothetical protein